MQFYYPNNRWGWLGNLWQMVVIKWLIDTWNTGETTTLFTDDYYHLWCPVQQDEFPY